MLEILEDLSVLKSPALRLTDLALAGVSHGCEARDFPVARVVEVSLAPIVKSGSWSREQGHVYKDEGGRELELSEVIANAFEYGGVLHFQEKVSFRLESGRVVGFSIYGSHLDEFSYIKSQEQLVREFGQPDVLKPNEAYGDLMGYYNSYHASQKFVAWDDWKKKIYVISLGMKAR